MSRYLLKWPLGEGGMGTVWEAERVLANGDTQPVACKIMHESLNASSDTREMFYREALVNLQIAREHPGIVLTYDCATDKRGRMYLIMERVEGCSLAALTRAYKQLPDAIVRLIIRRALDPIAYMHECEVLHRDISPSNILITTGGDVKIADFGLCKPIPGGSARASHTRGKVAYMSPEVFACRTLDTRADLYSVGAMLWELLGGQPPFGADSLVHVAARMDAWKLTPLPDSAPRDLRKLAFGWVRADPAERSPRSAADGYDWLFTRARRERAAESMLSQMVTWLFEREYARQQRAFEADSADGVRPGRFIDAVSIIDEAGASALSGDRTRSDGQAVSDTVPYIKRSDGAAGASGPQGGQTDEQDSAESTGADPVSAALAGAELADESSTNPPGAPAADPASELPEDAPPPPFPFPLNNVEKYPLDPLPEDQPEDPTDPEANEPTDPGFPPRPPGMPDPMRWQRVQRARARRTRRTVLAACVLGFLALQPRDGGKPQPLDPATTADRARPATPPPSNADPKPEPAAAESNPAAGGDAASPAAPGATAEPPASTADAPRPDLSPSARSTPQPVEPERETVPVDQQLARKGKILENFARGIMDRNYCISGEECPNRKPLSPP